MTNAQRQKRYRCRRDAGVRVVSVEVSPETANTLIRFNLLNAWNERDPNALKRAVQGLLAKMVEIDRDGNA
jgi:hypothetical protein